jgi:hypothetical protein
MKDVRKPVIMMLQAGNWMRRYSGRTGRTACLSTKTKHVAKAKVSKPIMRIRE